MAQTRFRVTRCTLAAAAAVLLGVVSASSVKGAPAEYQTSPFGGTGETDHAALVQRTGAEWYKFNTIRPMTSMTTAKMRMLRSISEEWSSDEEEGQMDSTLLGFNLVNESLGKLYELSLRDGPTLVCEEMCPQENVPPLESDPRMLFVYTHGQGHTHRTDLGCYAVHRALCGTKKFLPFMPDQILRTVMYDTRGSGLSELQEKFNLRTDQFTWKSLGKDMVQVAEGFAAGADQRILLGGTSKGAMTAIWAATARPKLARGLVLARIPHVWKWRNSERETLVAHAMRKKKRRNYAENMGAANSDLPTPKLLNKIKVPVLILSAVNEKEHPLKGAIALKEALPDAQLVRFDSAVVMAKNFGRVLSKWLHQKFGYPLANHSGTLRKSAVLLFGMDSQVSATMDFDEADEIDDPETVDEHFR